MEARKRTGDLLRPKAYRPRSASVYHEFEMFMKNAKQIISCLLSIFLVLSIFMATIKQFRTADPTSLPEGKSLILFHAQTRCPTCLKMERLTRSLLEEHFQSKLKEGKLHFILLEFDDPQNRSIVEEYHIATTSILLIDRQENRTIKSRDLLDKCWNSIENETLFRDMLLQELTGFLEFP